VYSAGQFFGNHFVRWQYHNIFLKENKVVSKEKQYAAQGLEAYVFLSAKRDVSAYKNIRKTIDFIWKV
jgi:hypothetical protein